MGTTTAARYSLPVAALRNTAGQFVTPTITSLLAGVVVMKPSAVTDVLAADPVTPAPATLKSAALGDYVAFVRYAVGPGQQLGVALGQLPPGMVPLPDALPHFGRKPTPSRRRISFDGPFSAPFGLTMKLAAD